MIFVVDIGNSRVKWGTYAEDRVRDAGQADYASSPAAALDALTAAVPAGVEHAVVANVGGDDIAAALESRLREQRGVALRRAATRSAACGVRCAYADPSRLGVDRWAALVGAYAPGAGACIVVDAGTTVTVDVLAADGNHLGGLILAGPELVTDSLARGTARIPRYSVHDAARPGVHELFGRDTRSAVVHGALLAPAAAVDRAARAAGLLLGAAPRAILTGGMAPAIEAWLDTAFEYRADLVLEGLGRLAAACEDQ